MIHDLASVEALTTTFRAEAVELLAELEAVLLEAETRLDDPELLARVFRALHTIKGSAGMFGLEPIVTVAHALESAFDAVRAGRVALGTPLVALALTGKDLIQSLLASPAGTDPALADASRRLVEGALALSGAPGPVAPPAAESLVAPPPAAGRGRHRFRVSFRPDPGLLQDGTNAIALWTELRSLGDCEVVADVTEVPPLDQMDPERCYLRWEAVLDTDHEENAIRDVFIFVEDRGELHIDRLEAAAPALVVATPAPAAAVGAVVAPAEPQAEADVDEGRAARRAASTPETTSVRVTAAKLDQLVDLVGELVIARARLSAIAAERDDVELTAVAENIDRLTADLRDNALNLRMVPIGTTFSRFRRQVRDLAAELGKEIELCTEGGDTELDKSMIERLGDPLVHLIRNSCDHGIETPEARVAAGKPAVGHVTLSAYQSGPSVVIEIRDDGRGLDADKLRAQAISRGLVAEDAQLSEHELFQLAFSPGLSTAERVSSVSGRGVGMDIVKRSVESLRGNIEMESVRGAGTTLRIRLPLTLAIIEGLLVAVGAGRYVLPMSLVEECVEITRDDVQRAHGSHVARVRGELVPYLRLREWFDEGSERPAIEQVAIASSGGVRFGFVVDDVIGQHQTVIKALGQMYRNVHGLSGATILGDGTVALIVDVPGVIRALSAAGEENGRTSLGGGGPSARTSAPQERA